MRHVARATRLAAVATSVLLILLLNWATVMAAVPSAPDITGPTGIQSSGDVTITWVAPPEGADSYNVAVYDWYNETWPLPSTNTDGCSYYVAGLMDNHGFIICVQAINADGPGPLAYSYFDVCSTGEAPSDQPVLTAPRALSDTDPGNPLDVTFTWDHVDKAGRYWLAVNEWHNTYWTTVFAVIVPDTGPGEPISYGPYTFLEGHYYSAWLMSANPVGAGPFNDCLYFGVSTLGHAPDAPTITQFAVEYSDAPIPLSDTQFEWSSTEKTLGYYFVLCDEDTNVEVGAWWQFDSGTGVNTFNLPSGITLVGGHLYWFGVAGWNPWGFGTWASVTFVAAAPLTVTADAQSKFYGADNPELTFTCSGLVNGDTADEVLTGGLSTTATTGSAAGTYPISQGTLAATGYYYIGMFNDANLTVIPDTTPPAISIWYPNNGVFLLGTVSIGGEITDSGSGVNWSTLSVTLNGMEYGAYHEDSFFCCEPSYLADGVYSLAVSVYDNAYNHATAQSTFTLDTTPPTVTITNPPDGSLTRTLPTVTGQASDSLSGVHWSTFSATANDNPMEVTVTHDSNGNFSFQFSNGLADDYYVIAVNVKDIAGNPAQAAYTTFTLDRRPTITISSLCITGGLTGDESGTLNGESVNFTNSGAMTLLLTGSVDYGVMQNVVFTATGDGGTYMQNVPSSAAGGFGITGRLQINSEGRYTLSASATAVSASGETASADLPSTCQEVLIVDKTPPVLTFTLPARYSMTDDKDTVFINGMPTGINADTRAQRGVNCYNKYELLAAANVDDLSGVSTRSVIPNSVYITDSAGQTIQSGIQVAVGSQGNITTYCLPTDLAESIMFGFNDNAPARRGLPQFRVYWINGKYTWNIHLTDRCGNLLDEGMFKLWVDRTPPPVSAGHFTEQDESLLNGTGIEKVLPASFANIKYVFSTFDAVEAWQGLTGPGDDGNWLFKNLRSTTLLPEHGQEADIEQMNPSWRLKQDVALGTDGGEENLCVIIRDIAGNYCTRLWHVQSASA